MEKKPLTPAERKRDERKRMKKFLMRYGFNSLEALGTSLKKGDEHGKQFVHAILRRWNEKESAAICKAGTKATRLDKAKTVQVV